jgi:hypothetical protein
MGDEGIPFNFKGNVNQPIVRSFEDEMKFIKKLSPWKYEIEEGFVTGMNVYKKVL